MQFVLSFFSKRLRKQRSIEQRLAVGDQEQLALIASMSNFGFWSLDLASEQVWANNHARSVLGLDEKAPLTRTNLFQAIHPDDHEVFLAAIDKSSQQAQTIEIELRVIGINRELHWIAARLSVSDELKGRGPRVSGYVIDERQHKRAASELLKLQQKLTHLTRVALLGELSGALAHELQQPLTAILANAQAAQLLAEKDQIEAVELKEILREIIDDDKHAGQIISSLRALLIRAETQIQRVEMQSLLADVLVLARGTLMERNVQVHTRIDENIPAILGNRVELKQVLLNLVLNACEAMTGNPARDRRIEIVVDQSPQGGAVRTSVLDCGRGLDSDVLQRVFEPFFTTKENGLGLGLAISHSIVASHGGRLWATNRSDRGAAFHFTLPIAPEDATH
jgi:two-component system, LuxR family, sensor kinase FixL